MSWTLKGALQELQEADELFVLADDIVHGDAENDADADRLDEYVRLENDTQMDKDLECTKDLDGETVVEGNTVYEGEDTLIVRVGERLDVTTLCDPSLWVTVADASDDETLVCVDINSILLVTVNVLLVTVHELAADMERDVVRFHTRQTHPP
jgi:hypothetical protein